MKIGKIPENTWKRSVKKMLPGHMINDKGAGIGRDCALFHNMASDCVNGSVLVSESCVVPFCERMGALGVYLASNAVNGNMARVSGVMISLFLDGRTGQEFVEHVAKDAGLVADQLSITIAGFDVHVLHGIKKPYLTCYGVGTEIGYISEKPCSDASIIMTGFAGMSGTAMVLSDKSSREKLLERFPLQYIKEAKDLTDDLSINKVIDLLEGKNLSYFKPLGEGGINGALWEMAAMTGKGLTVNLKKIPIMQETVEVCNFFDLNPYILHSSGAFLFVANDADSLVSELISNGVNAEVIGMLTKSNDKLIINDDEKRFITLPQADAIYEIF